MICPNCKNEVDAATAYKVVDRHGVAHYFHSNCVADVNSGWSGSITIYQSGESFEDLYRRCMKTNYGVLNIEL